MEKCNIICIFEFKYRIFKYILVNFEYVRNMYFNYHAKIKRLIKEGHLIDYEFLDEYRGIRPVLLLYFDNNRPMPIREYKWDEYLPLLNNINNT